MTNGGQMHGMLLPSAKCSRPPSSWENPYMKVDSENPLNGPVIPLEQCLSRLHH